MFGMDETVDYGKSEGEITPGNKMPALATFYLHDIVEVVNIES